jgi:eukaryotic-like serine/threonine-protein kinase
MSPEQATGDRVIDARSDVYSLAAVLYEMLTGEPPHTGNTAQAIIARLLTETPRSMRTARPAVPTHVDAAVQRALEKLPADRFATAQEFSDVLTGRAVLPPAADAGDAPERTKTSATWRAAARHPVTLAVLALAVFGWGGMLARPRPAADAGGLASATVRFMLEPMYELGDGSGHLVALSPDGRSLLVDTEVAAGGRETWLRHLDSYAAQRLPFRAIDAAFSPDGRSLAYIAAGQIARVDLAAITSPVRVGAAPAVAGMAWIGDRLLMGRPGEALQVVPAAGGEPRPLMALDTAAGELSQRYPVALPDGETVLYASMRGRGIGRGRVGVVSLRTMERGYFDVDGVPLGLIDGMLIYADESGIRGVPVDVRRRRVTGPALALVDNSGFAALSPTGTLVHMSGRAETQLHEVDEFGATEAVLPPRGSFESPRYSPDGRRVLVTLLTESVGEIWVHDVPTGTFSPVARREHSARAEWSPDGLDILFLSGPADLRTLWRQPVDGTAAPELVLTEGEHGVPGQGVFTPDGRHLVFRTDRRDIWYRAWTGDTASRPLAADPAVDERNPHISPDGRWVAYTSNETGVGQVYVRPFPGPGPRRAVTVDGGNTPVWTPDGRRIIYINGDYFEEATIALEPEFTVSRRRLFEHGRTWCPCTATGTFPRMEAASCS